MSIDMRNLGIKHSWKGLILVSILLACASGKANAQYRLNLGVFGGWNATFFQIEPQDPNLENGVAFFPNSVGAKAELRLGSGPYYLKGDFSYFSDILLFKPSETIFFSINPSVDEVFLGRLGIKRRIPLIKNRLFFSPGAGIGLGTVPGHGSGFSTSFNTSQGLYTFSYRFPIQPDRVAAFAYAGIDIELQFTNGMVLFLSASYNQGLVKFLEEDVSYQFNNDPPTTLRFFTRGSHLPIQMGLSYPISRIWEGKIEIE
jgi:hypothetical protein